MAPRRAPSRASAPVADPTAPFSETVGSYPFTVVVEERMSRGGTLYLRWWDKAKGNWRPRSLASALREANLGATSLRDANGIVIERVKAWAIDQAYRQHRILAGLALDEAPGGRGAAPLTIGQTWAKITDPKKGKYPEKTPHRDEVQRALTFAEIVWGKERAWATIGRGELTELMRTRLDQLVAEQRALQAADPTVEVNGLRGTEVTMSRILAVAVWLRDEGHIPLTAAVPKSTWKQDLREYWLSSTKLAKLPAPHRPRFTLEHTKKLMRAAAAIDPRYWLALALAAEYRLGQAIRSRRSDLVLERTIEDAPHGTFTIHGRGHKEGEVVYLTRGQRRAAERALATYLAPLEAQYQAGKLKDYPLFPGGDMVGLRGGIRGRTPTFGKGALLDRPVSRGWLRKVFPRVRAAAQLPPVKGLGAYGMRRVNVDAALDEDISPRGLQAAGGWAGPEVPNTIYAERENRAGRREAMETRAKIRGELEDELLAPEDSNS